MGVKCPGPPLPGLGIKQPDSLRREVDLPAEVHSGARWDIPEEMPGADPTGPPPAQVGLGPEEFIEFDPELSQGSGGAGSFTHMMYMQEMWGDEDWVPSAGAASSSHGPVDPPGEPSTAAPTQPLNPNQIGLLVPEEIAADPTDSPPSQSLNGHRCMALRLADPDSSNSCHISSSQVEEIPADGSIASKSPWFRSDDWGSHI